MLAITVARAALLFRPWPARAGWSVCDFASVRALLRAWVRAVLRAWGLARPCACAAGASAVRIAAAVVAAVAVPAVAAARLAGAAVNAASAVAGRIVSFEQLRGIKESVPQ